MKKLGKKLSLSRETIRDLNDSQLREAAGGLTQFCLTNNPRICGPITDPQLAGGCETDGCTSGCNTVSVTTCICQTGNGTCVTDGCCG